MNSGKKFELDFKKSVPSNVFYYRFKDGTSSWGGNEKVRFQSKNICDCFIFYNSLYLFELKSHKGKSIPFSCFRKNQLEDLSNAMYFENIKAGCVINFSELERTFFVKIEDIVNFMRTSDRKSLDIEYIEKVGIELERKKLKVNFKYNIKKLLEEI